MRTAYDAWREHDRYENMSEFDRMLVDEYRADKMQERADRYDEQRAMEESWEDDE